MRYVTVKVLFETSFTYEIEDDEFDEDFEDQCIEDTVNTLADPTNQYWRDAEFDVEEVYPDGDTIREIDGRYTCIACGYEWSAMMGDDEVPEKCACQINPCLDDRLKRIS